jgi:hypothetical protein
MNDDQFAAAICWAFACMRAADGSCRASDKFVTFKEVRNFSVVPIGSVNVGTRKLDCPIACEKGAFVPP